VLSRSQQTATLIEIHLGEGQVGRALELLSRAPRPPFGYGASLDLKVAQAAEATYPRDALDIYRRHVEQIVEHRSRGAYGEAAQLILRIRGLYERLGERQIWDAYLADVRARTKALRAFKAELEAVGLQ
jgi:uncharacterized Zn finger protein